MIFQNLTADPAGFSGLQYLVVGSGFYGSVMAERIARDKGLRVVVLEKRGHIGGNCYSENDPGTGIEWHCYGSHIFHTGDEQVWAYLNRFCSFNSYRHKVLTRRGGRTYTMPIDLDTINAFYGTEMTAGEAGLFIRREAAGEAVPVPANLEQQAVSMYGRPLYEAFIKGYTAKQWGRHPKDLPPEIIARLPPRFDRQPAYFNDPRQGIPREGYGKLFENLLSHPKIDTYLNTDFFDLRRRLPAGCRIIYTGPVDRYFDHACGTLDWRSLRFEKETFKAGDFQGTAVVNYAEESVPFTRIHEFRHFHEERAYPADRTLLAREYPCECAAGREPYYPVNTAGDREVLARYAARIRADGRLIPGGRLGTYRYLNMDQCVASALEVYEREIKNAA